jgi:hypothetical protein
MKKQHNYEELLEELTSLAEAESSRRRRVWFDSLSEDKRQVLEKLRDRWRAQDIKANLTAIHQQCQKALGLSIGYAQFSRWMKGHYDG